MVAGEVKELARQTARATGEIRTRVEGIQGDTTGAVAAIREISEVIGRINQIQIVIASSVEEQAATMNEISGNSAEAARGSAEIAQNISHVSDAAKSSTHAAGRTSSAATALLRLSGELGAVVARFKLSGENDDPELRPLVPVTVERSCIAN